MDIERFSQSSCPEGEMSDTLLHGRYQQLAEIGRGEHTVVYKALDTSLDRTVTVKVLRERYAADADFAERFLDAARATAALSHPNIVDIYDIGSDRDLHYVVSEYVEGENLESFLTEHALPGPEKALDIALPVCDALGAAHRAGYVHGHLTPRNILLSTDGQVKVADLRALEPAPVAAAEPARSLHSALYLSPEQLMGRRATPASDVYSAAIIVYEMIAGRPPFYGETYAEVAEQHIRTEPPLLHVANPHTPPSLSGIVRKALAKTSTDRYRSGSDLAQALRGFQRESATREFMEAVQIEEAAAAGMGVRRHQADGAPSWPVDAGSAGADEGARLPIDFLGCLVGIVALVATLGLIPLWLAVYLRYF
jgi:serine/threonine protein kinase